MTTEKTITVRTDLSDFLRLSVKHPKPGTLGDTRRLVTRGFGADGTDVPKGSLIRVLSYCSSTVTQECSVTFALVEGQI